MNKQNKAEATINFLKSQFPQAHTHELMKVVFTSLAANEKTHAYLNNMSTVKRIVDEQRLLTRLNKIQQTINYPVTVECASNWSKQCGRHLEHTVIRIETFTGAFEVTVTDEDDFAFSVQGLKQVTAETLLFLSSRPNQLALLANEIHDTCKEHLGTDYLADNLTLVPKRDPLSAFAFQLEPIAQITQQLNQ